MELAIAAASALISALVGAGGGVAALVKLSGRIERRFDSTDRSLQDLMYRYDLQREKDIARVEMIEYQLSQAMELINHKSKRCENAIYQLSRYLEKHHDYSPRSMFPLEKLDNE